eukprot:119935-Alexandrium_andersonii.AAC.1
MSASLVGSEMCIRDSFPFLRPLRPLRRSPPDVLRLLFPPPPLAAKLSVSYTHLTLPTICSV